MLFPSLTRCALGLAAVVLAAGFFARSAHAGAVISRPLYLGLDQGLVGYWNFDGKTISGTRVFDASGTGNYGTMTNGPRLVSGKLGQGMLFDGSDDYVNVPSITLQESTTFSGWVNAKTWALGASGVTGIIVKGQWGGDLNGDIRIIIQGGQLRMVVNSSTGDHAALYATSNLSINTWYHVVGVCDKSSNKIRLYVNGVEQSSGGVTGTFSNNSHLISLGAYQNNESETGFTGAIDDVRVYNRALSADEIKRLYNIGGTVKLNSTPTSLTNGLVGWWTFDGKDVSGVQAYDRSGNGNRGILTNGPRLVSGKIGQAMQFDGQNDYVSAGVTNLTLSSEYTLSVWVNLGRAKVQQILQKVGATDKANYYITMEGTNDVTCGFRNSQDDNWKEHLTTGGLVTVGSWHHIACVFDDARNVMRIYIDGTQKLSEAETDSPYTAGSDTLNIGRNSFQPAWYLNGKADDVCIYNRALSADEIKHLYNMGR